MPSLEAERRSLQAKHAAAVRWDKPNQAETRRDLAAAKLEDFIQRTLAGAPPMTPATIDKLALLLRGGDAV